MTVVARVFISLPERSATDTWEHIVNLVAPHASSPARRELAAVTGVACSCISDEALADEALVVHGVGPRLRIYALYGDDAVDGERANESALSWVPTDGEWMMSMPCPADDLEWVQKKLAEASARITARALGIAIEDEEAGKRAAATTGDAASGIDLDAFLRR